MTTVTKKPDELSPQAWEALQFVGDPANWRPPHIAAVSRHLGHKNRRYGWELVTNLVRDGWLDPNLELTNKARKVLTEAARVGGKNG